MLGDFGDVDGEEPKKVPSSAAHGLSRALRVPGDLEPDDAVDVDGDFKRCPKMPDDVIGVLGADSLDGDRCLWQLPDRETWRRPKGDLALPWRDLLVRAGSSPEGSSIVGGSFGEAEPDDAFPKVRIRQPRDSATAMLHTESDRH